MKITYEFINELLNKYDGNHSVLYPYIKNKLTHYADYELPFPGEFLFFESTYLYILKHIYERGIIASTIVDIGCKFGIQSELFKDYNYIGIDYYNHNFLNSDKNKYIVERFPYCIDEYVNLYKPGTVVISSMSIGFFESNNDELTDAIEALSNVKNLYMVSDEKVIKKVYDKYNINNIELLCNPSNRLYGLYYFKR